MESAGVSYSLPRGNYGSIQLDPVVINLDLSNLQSDFEEIFNPSFVFFDNHFYYLTANLNCKLSSKDNVFTIDCPFLKIKVWGKTKEEVVNAFNFSFHSLVENFAKEDNANLSFGARKLKHKIRAIVA